MGIKTVYQVNTRPRAMTSITVSGHNLSSHLTEEAVHSGAVYVALGLYYFQKGATTVWVRS